MKSAVVHVNDSSSCQSTRASVLSLSPSLCWPVPSGSGTMAVVNTMPTTEFLAYLPVTVGFSYGAGAQTLIFVTGTSGK